MAAAPGSIEVRIIAQRGKDTVQHFTDARKAEREYRRLWREGQHVQIAYRPRSPRNAP